MGAPKPVKRLVQWSKSRADRGWDQDGGHGDKRNVEGVERYLRGGTLGTESLIGGSGGEKGK